MTRPADERKATVLVVDDEPVIRETILEILREEEFEALGMSNASEAITWAKRLKPDVILTDVVMPGLNGIDLAIQLSSSLPECRVILFSGQSAASDLLSQARKQGHQFEILPKPINPEVLIAKLRAAVSHSA
jgi:DNA-binding NtrC family response regulator